MYPILIGTALTAPPSWPKSGCGGSIHGEAAKAHLAAAICRTSCRISLFSTSSVSLSLMLHHVFWGHPWPSMAIRSSGHRVAGNRGHQHHFGSLLPAAAVIRISGFPWIAQQAPLRSVTLFQQPIGQVQIEEARTQLPTNLLRLSQNRSENHWSPF